LIIFGCLPGGAGYSNPDPLLAKEVAAPAGPAAVLASLSGCPVVPGQAAGSWLATGLACGTSGVSGGDVGGVWRAWGSTRASVRCPVVPSLRPESCA
jgi:hypothetical protein